MAKTDPIKFSISDGYFSFRQLWIGLKSKTLMIGSSGFFSRGDRIRTYDPLVPNQVR